MNEIDLREFQKLTDDKGTVVREIQIFKKGTFSKNGSTPFTVDSKWMNKMIENFHLVYGKDIKDRIPLDYNHGSLSEDPEGAKAAGWLQELVAKEDGLYAKFKFTKKAQQYIREEEYKYISPEFNPFSFAMENGEEIDGPMLLAVGLTNRPFLKNMEPVKMTEKHKEEKVDKKKLAEALGLKVDCTEEEIYEAIAKKMKASDETSGIKEALKLSEGETAEEKIKILMNENEEKKTENQKLSERIDKVVAELEDTKTEQCLQKWKDAGKIVPSTEEKAKERLKKLGVEMFNEIMEDQPVLANVNGPKGQAGQNKEGDGNPQEEYFKEVEKVSEEKKLSFSDAMDYVGKHQPELAQKYAESVQGR